VSVDFAVDRQAWRHLADAQVNVELDTGDMILNLGPQHPATHGTLRLVVRLDGERVIAADPVIGYMHRGYEKLTEFRTYPQITTLINRIDWLSSFANEVPFISGAEMLMGIEAPPRAQYIRTVLTELSRIATFLLFLGEMGLQVGAITPAFYGFRDREYVLNLIEAVTGGRFHPNFVSDLAELVKARLTLLVLLTTAVGFYLGAESPINYKALFQTVFGTAAAAAGAAALNQWWERRADALMHRTKTRPLPAGRMAPLQALVLGSALSVFGVVYLAIFCNALSALLTAITVAIYIFAYTPLKRTSTANTAVGAIPGAIPPMIGWAAARGDIGPGAWSLFVIVFLWQMPHFFAIAWMCREDYSRAGFRMISSDDSSGERSASQSVFFCILLLVLAGLPAFVGVASYVYQPIELLLGGLFVAVAMRFLRLRTPSAARLLFFASIAYLPLLLTALVLTKL